MPQVNETGHLVDNNVTLRGYDEGGRAQLAEVRPGVRVPAPYGLQVRVSVRARLGA
jgi:hypothetical protein